MSNVFSILLSLFISTACLGQITNQSDLIGKWKVEKIIEAPNVPEFTSLIEGFKSSTFYFNENKTFSINSTNETELFKMMILEVLIEPKWRFDKIQNTAQIGNENDDYSAMEIIIYQVEENVMFLIEESGILFQMKKT